MEVTSVIRIQRIDSELVINVIELERSNSLN